MFEQERQMLEHAGNQVIPYCRTNWDVDSYKGLRRISLAKSTIWSSESRRTFAELLKHEKPDLVHVHNTFVMISPSIYSACYEAKVPVVQTLHNYRLMCPAGTFFRDGKVCEECMEGGLLRGVQHACYHGSHSATAIVALMLATHRATRDLEAGNFLLYRAQRICSREIRGGRPAARKDLRQAKFRFSGSGRAQQRWRVRAVYRQAFAREGCQHDHCGVEEIAALNSTGDHRRRPGSGTTAGARSLAKECPTYISKGRCRGTRR